MKIPKVKQSDIIRIIIRDFSIDNLENVFEILKGYDSKNENGKNRVYAAILKLSDGNLNTLRENVDKANKDYRDVISLSEYPNYWKCAFDVSITSKEEKKLISDDWKQYQDWFNR